MPPGTQSSPFPGGMWNNTSLWAWPSHFAKHFRFLSEPPDRPVRQARWVGRFIDIKTGDQTGPCCKDTAEPRDSPGFPGQSEAGLPTGSLAQVPGNKL